MKKSVRGFVVEFGEISSLLNMSNDEIVCWQRLQEGMCCSGCGVLISGNSSVIAYVSIDAQDKLQFVHERECLIPKECMVIQDDAELRIAVAMLLAQDEKQEKKRKALVA